jgi:hypothetical protein
MDVNVVDLAAQYGVLGSLLFLFMYWLVKQYLPEHQQQHREELERILECHDRNTNRLVEAMERLTQIVHFNSQALLVHGFIKNGLTREEAQDIADRLAVSIGACSLTDEQRPRAA